MRPALLFLCAAWSLLAGPAIANPDVPDISALVRAEAAAVVSVTGVYSDEDAGDGDADEALDPLAALLARLLGADVPAQGPSLGAGFLVSEDGYVVTNAHLVAGARANEVRVRLADGRELAAQVVGFDPSSDIALLKVAANGLPRVRIGDPARLQPGDWVAAIGSPFGFQRSVTAGVVSATGRALPDEGYVSFIQTDVALNPGSSGGPLFNLSGEVVGVNSVIFSATGGYMGISFAVPIDIAMEVAEELRLRGRVTRGDLGVLLQEVSPLLAEAFGLAGPGGALVLDLARPGPAERAGLRAADVIVALDGAPVATPADLMRVVSRRAPGSAVALEVLRDGKALQVSAVLQAAPPSRTAAAVQPDRPGAPLGLRVVPLDAARQARLGTEGLLVLQAAGAAGRAGLAAGDIVVSVNGRTTPTLQAFRSAAGEARPGSVLALLVQRGRARAFVPLRVPE